jgi:hypothetical protein
MIINIFYPSDHLIQFFKTKLCAVYKFASLHMFKKSCCQVNACTCYYYTDIILSDNYQLSLPVTMYVELTQYTQLAKSTCSAVVAQVMSSDTCHTV